MVLDYFSKERLAILRVGVKKGVCGLICFLMILTAASLWDMFGFCAFGLGEETIDVHLSNDFKKAKEKFNEKLRDEPLKQASVVNIILDQDIEVNYNSNFSKIVGMGNGYLFDFSSNKFKDKIINIKSSGKNIFKIKNKNPNIGFLNAKGCTVNLENVSVVGGAAYKGEYKIPCAKVRVDSECVDSNRDFINLFDNCVLNLNNLSEIKDVYISSAKYHVINLNDSQINMNGGGVSGCRIESEYGCPAGGAVYADNQSSVVLNSSGYITKCSLYQPDSAKGGAVCLDNGSMLEIKSGGRIDNCCVAADWAVGGAISAEHKSTVIMENGSLINRCSALGRASCAGAIFVDLGACLDLRGGEISDCKAKEYGDAIYFAGSGEFKLASPGGSLQIKLPQGLDNSHNSDISDVGGYQGIYKYGAPLKANACDASFYKIPVEFSFKTELVIDKKFADRFMLDFIDMDMKKFDFSGVKWKYTDISGSVNEINDQTKVSDFAVLEKK